MFLQFFTYFSWSFIPLKDGTHECGDCCSLLASSTSSNWMCVGCQSRHWQNRTVTSRLSLVALFFFDFCIKCSDALLPAGRLAVSIMLSNRRVEMSFIGRYTLHYVVMYIQCALGWLKNVFFKVRAMKKILIKINSSFSVLVTSKVFFFF